MAYGQTGTGKSLSISGLNKSFDDRGILPRLITNLFISKKHKETHNKQIRIQVSYIEISKNYLADLLINCPNAISSMKEVRKIKVKRAVDALKLLFLGCFFVREKKNNSNDILQAKAGKSLLRIRLILLTRPPVFLLFISIRNIKTKSHNAR